MSTILYSADNGLQKVAYLDSISRELFRKPWLYVCAERQRYVLKLAGYDSEDIDYIFQNTIAYRSWIH